MCHGSDVASGRVPRRTSELLRPTSLARTSGDRSKAREALTTRAATVDGCQVILAPAARKKPARRSGVSRSGQALRLPHSRRSGHQIRRQRQGRRSCFGVLQVVSSSWSFVAAWATKQARHRQTARGCLSGIPVDSPPERTLPLLHRCLQVIGVLASGLPGPPAGEIRGSQQLASALGPGRRRKRATRGGRLGPGPLLSGRAIAGVARPDARPHTRRAPARASTR